MWFRPSGGILYHWRAWRSKSNWKDFRLGIERWLNEWNPSSKELLLIGPSGGYTIPSTWLKKFTSIKAFDQDPLAPYFFRKNHPQVPVSFTRKNLFWKDGKLDFKILALILRDHPESAVLFCNVLGQVLLEGKATELEWSDYLKNLRTLLKEREWASYHDLYTHENGQIIDHLMQGEWSQSIPARRLQWQLTPNSLHIVEALQENCL